VKLRALSEEDIQKLLSAFRDEPPSLDYVNMAKSIASKVDTIPRKDALEIVTVVFSLYFLRARDEMPPSELAEGICRAMEDSGVEDLKLPGRDRQYFKDQLTKLLSVGSLDIGTKAIDVLNDNERAFRSARVLTDIRPIFGSNPKSSPAAAVLVQMLKISYRGKRGRTENFFVALDTTDVGDLIDVLERANTKAESLRSILKDADVPYVERSGES